MHLTCWRGRRGHTAHWARRQAAAMKGTEECKGCVCVWEEEDERGNMQERVKKQTAGYRTGKPPSVREES